MVVFNYRLNFYPIFRSDDFYFGELQVPALMREYADRIGEMWVYDDGAVKGFVQVTGREIVKLFVEPVLQGNGIGAALLRAGIPLIFMCVILQGVLRDGIASWMPNFISETYHIENAGAVMTTSVLPIFSVVCVFVTGRVHRRIDNEQKTASIFWTVAVLSAALLMIAYFSSVAVLTIVFMGLLNAAMHGINYLLTSRVSPRIQKYNRVSAVTGAINACTYVGSAVSTYGFALLSDHLGWSATLWSWLIVAALGLLCTLLCVKR
jgi:OPA family glycerol-3-phosphate transporter-like MFS transporter